MATLNNCGEYQNWQFAKIRSRLSNQHVQIQINNKFLLLGETIEDQNEAENGNQEEIYPNNNIPTSQREKQQSRRPEFPITVNYITTGAAHIKNNKRIVTGN